MSDYKRVLTIQDISCIGQCSLTVALPLLSCCGLETAVLPSAVLSTHTGGFKGYTFRDLTEDMPKIAEHWRTEDLRFDAIYSGYLGSARQVEIVREIMTTLGKDGCVRIVDPAMADNGVLYTGFADDFPSKMARLCQGADYLLPNLTEAALLVGEKPRLSGYSETDIRRLISRVHELGAKNVVLTGVSFEEELLGTAISDGVSVSYDFNPRLRRSSHGTGDVFASIFAGAILRGKSAVDAAALAADVVCAAIDATDDDHWYGVSFEKVMPLAVNAFDKP